MSHPTPIFARMAGFLLFSLLVTAAEQVRDPFWPIGYEPAGTLPPVPTATPRPVAEAAPLSDEELRRWAMEESARLQKQLAGGRGIVQAGDKIFATIQGQVVTVGDAITVTVDGRNYRLVINKLTTDNIELVPHRVQPGHAD